MPTDPDIHIMVKTSLAEQNPCLQDAAKPSMRYHAWCNCCYKVSGLSDHPGCQECAPIRLQDFPKFEYEKKTTHQHHKGEM